MFKLLLLVALGIAFVAASPAAEAREHFRVERSATGEKIKIWWKGIEEKISNWASKVKSKFQNFWDKITGKAASREKQEKLNQLKKEYEQLREESARSVQRRKADWDAILEEHEKKLEQLKKDADESVSSEMKQWDERFDQLKKKAEIVINQ